MAGQAKHAYSLLSQAYTSAVAKHDDSVFWETDPDIEGERSIFEKYLFPELKGQNSGCRQKIKDNSLHKNCKNYIKIESVKNTYFTLENKFNNFGCFALDGGELIFTESTDRPLGDFDMQYYISSVIVDVNGFKSPNQVGKDIFLFYIIMQPRIHDIYLATQGGNIANFHHKGIFPAGYDGKGNAYSCTRYSDIMLSPQCTAKLMKDGWEFKDDYPW